MSIYKSQAGKEAVEARYRQALARWPVPHRQFFVPTRQGDTFVIACGMEHAPPVVLFHGSGTNSSMWMRDVAVWSQHYRVYAVDMIGEPGFSAPSRPPLGSDAYADWLDNVWGGLGLTAASIVGISLGGWLALDYAVKRPARVASLSLISPAGIGAQNHMFLLKVGLLRLCGQWGLRKSLHLVAGNGGATSPTNGAPSALAEWVLLVFRHFRPRMEKLPIRTDRELASLIMPVQAILGGKDVMLRSQETRDRLQRHVANLQLTFLEDAGHLLPPQTEAVSTFLRSARVATPVSAALAS